MALPNTHLGAEKISKILSGKKNLFFVGIGGISMNSLAKISHLHGYNVSGYDRTPSEITENLEKMGIKVCYESDEKNVYDCDALIYTVAIPESNAEYSYAKSHSIPVISRADFLGYIMTGYTHRIGVSGTHGKSTTTGMIADVLVAAEKDPTVFNGAPMRINGSTDVIGKNEYFVFEACEYMDSFLDFNPTCAVVLNLELDHVDYFKSIEQIRESFHRYINLTGMNGYAIINRDCENCMLMSEGYSGKKITFSRNDLKADFYSANEDLSNGYPSFDIMSEGELLTHVTLRVPGEHSISDALAAFASCYVSGISPDVIGKGLSSYEGISRRMEKICTTPENVDVYADYAHHPTEIATTVSGAKKICKGKLNIIFQPHTFSRTAELFDGFVSSLSETGADSVILCDIYSARETNIYGITSEDLAKKISERGVPSFVAPSFFEASECAEKMSSDGDTIIIMGAGDVIKCADYFKKCE